MLLVSQLRKYLENSECVSMLMAWCKNIHNLFLLIYLIIKKLVKDNPTMQAKFDVLK